MNLFPLSGKLILSLLMAFGICYFLIPPITQLAREKNIVAIPDSRTSHEYLTPTIGGVAIYFAFILTTLVFAGITNEPFLPYMTASTLIIFLVGIKDDVYKISPRVKLLGQFVAIIVAVVLANIRITNFQGVFGIYEISYLGSIAISFLIFVGLTNALNLMDGIDGLAASLGIVACLGFGLFFFAMEKYGATIVCAAMIGSLLAFLRFNYAGPKKKIFMGDTGSLMLGFLVAGVAIRYNEINLVAPANLKLHSSPVISMAILAIPIFDTLRVMLFRMLKGRSPFRPDKSHIHHVLLTKGYTHHQATIYISSFSILLIILIYYIQYLVSGTMLLFILFAIVATFYLFPFSYFYQHLRAYIKGKLK